MTHHLRIARPVRNIAQTTRMYREGLGLRILGQFQDHELFDGVMLGRAGMPYHFEFTYCNGHIVTPTPTSEDLLVFYLPDTTEWQEACVRMQTAGFKQVAASNPYWNVRGQAFEDPDGYQIVLQNAEWVNEEWVNEE
jgi:catechol 2,3-dioxygenase-like lactoylglutathione lyase family enzyme